MQSTQAEWQLSQAFVKGFRPAPEVLVSDWADAKRMMGSASARKGPWRTDVVPYTRELMNNFSPMSPVEIIVLMKAAQGAGTEVLLNVLGCIMDRYPAGAMLVLPTTGTAKKFVRTRLDPMIEICPVLREAVAKPRSREASNTTTMKEFHGCQLLITGANSGPDLRSFPSKYALCDEINGYPLDLDHEGSPVDLVIQRTGSFRGRKIGLVSTPTLDGMCEISKWHVKGDQRLYMVPCPLCGREQALIFGSDRVKQGRPGGLRWPKGSPDQVRYQCEYCGDEFEEWRKIEALSRGEWVPQAPGVGGGKIRSYQINALYYPHGWPGNNWSNLAAAWDADHADPIKRKTFWNLKLGLPWKDPAEAKADANELLARCESYGPEIPRQVAVLTAGADVQANRIELELVGWGKEEESWSIEHRVFLGDTSRSVGIDSDHPSPWEQLDNWLGSEYLSELGIPLRVAAMCVDAGYNTHIAAKWCGDRFTRRIWATIGRSGRHPIWPKKPGRTKATKSPIFTIGVDSIKENIYARLRLADPGPGFLHFSKGHNDRNYFDQLTSEIRIPNYTGPIAKFEWRKKTAGARNEILDCRGGSYAALQGLVAGGLRLNQEVESLERLALARITPPEPVASVKPAEGQWIERRKGWLKG
ncbi:MAG: phage terminase GpA [Bryobacterales bacterium]|nr:phage terminase GpA [Bryobacterales bacterium]